MLSSTPSPSLPEPVLLALDALMDSARAENLIPEQAFLHSGEISGLQAYTLLLAAYNIVIRQMEHPTQETLHQLINMHFPLVSPWCPVFVPPPGPGTYWLARAYGPSVHVAARWRPKRGVPWGQWHPAKPGGLRGPLVTLQPGDRWRQL